MESQVIEFYQNGQYLGKAFDNISTGENIAYFPAISISKNERACFNFGGNPFFYTYPGYDALDIPAGIYKGTHDVTMEILEIIKSHTLRVLNLKQIPNIYKYYLSAQMFNFIGNVAFKDSYVLSKVIVPFLINLSQSKHEEFVLFFEYCLLFVENKSEFISTFIESN